MMHELLDLLAIDVPIVLAPMGGAVGPDLCAAVSTAGGLGAIQSWRLDPPALHEQVRAVRALTDRPFCPNLNNNYPRDEQVSAVIDAGVKIVWFFWGLNVAHIARSKAGGLIVVQTVGSAAEARRAVDAGVDIVVAQGWEAGGHVWGQVATLALVPAVVDAVPSTPVIAAGGIADGRGVAAVLALGAAAACVGTRFLVANEARGPQANAEVLIIASETDTIMGRDSTPTWRDSAMRWIGTSAGARPDNYRPDGSQLAGQGVGLVRRRQPAAEIVAEMWAEAQARIGGLAAASRALPQPGP